MGETWWAAPPPGASTLQDLRYRLSARELPRARDGWYWGFFFTQLANCFFEIGTASCLACCGCFARAG